MGVGRPADPGFVVQDGGQFDGQGLIATVHEISVVILGPFLLTQQALLKGVP